MEQVEQILDKVMDKVMDKVIIDVVENNGFEKSDNTLLHINHPEIEENVSKTNKPEIVKYESMPFVNEYMAPLNDTLLDKLNEIGYCEVEEGERKKNLSINLVIGWLRVDGWLRVAHDYNIPEAIVYKIFCFNGPAPDQDTYVEIMCGKENPKYFLTAEKNIKLCKFLMAQMPARCLVVPDVRLEIFEYVLQYLAHHKGKKPEEIAKPIRSVKMERIVADKWDAEFINGFTTNIIFQIAVAAADKSDSTENAKDMLNVPSLLHLAGAKIATLIRGKSPEEVRRIYNMAGFNQS